MKLFTAGAACGLRYEIRWVDAKGQSHRYGHSSHENGLMRQEAAQVAGAVDVLVIDHAQPEFEYALHGSGSLASTWGSKAAGEELVGE